MFKIFSTYKASTHTKNATKPNSSKILQLQTARKKINWTN